MKKINKVKKNSNLLSDKLVGVLKNEYNLDDIKQENLNKYKE